MESSGIYYERIPVTEKAFKEVLSFAYDHYKGKEPQEVYLGIGNEIIPAWNADLRDAFFKGCSVWARDVATGELVGVAINSYSTLEEADEEDCSIESFRNQGYPAAQAISHYIDTLVVDPLELMERYDVDRIFYVGHVIVHPNFGRRGIGNTLVTLSLTLAAAEFDYAYVIASSFFTQRIFEKMAFKCVNKLNYSEIRIDDRQVIFPSAPHVCTKSYIKKLDEVDCKLS